MWAMEKFQYLLLGRKFCVLTDHKAIEKINSQKEFGTSRITRWIDRINQFQFDVKYVSGNLLHSADVMSRSIKKENTLDKDKFIKKILKLHEQFSHRKNITKKLEEHDIFVSKNELKRILIYCKICNEYDKKIKSKFSFIKTFNVGERVGCDILEIKKLYW
ncbi:Retrovirus-related Pol polyprotein from transposon [Dictyocoela muelleri]|nr:Retrovirus-related Pol polyprotein from transposon [Dictyocoela muelleri]